MSELILCIALVLFIAVPFIIVYYLNNKKNLKQENINFNQEENIEYQKVDVVNEKNKMYSVINICIYILLFFVLTKAISLIMVKIYLSVNNISKDLVDSNSPLFNKDVFNTMANVLNPILQLVIYLLAIIPIFILSFKMITKDLKRTKGISIGYAFLGFGLVYCASIFGMMILTLLGVKGESSNEQAIVDMMNANKIAPFILFFVTVILAPIIEELVFRKSIFNLIKDEKLALVVSSLCFGLLHVISPAILVLMQMFTSGASFYSLLKELIYIIPYSLMGLAIGYSYVKSKQNIVTPILAHSLNNFVSFMMTLLLPIIEEFLKNVSTTFII